MMNRQIRSKKLLVQLNVSLLVEQSKFKPSKREIRLPRSSYSPGGTCGYLVVVVVVVVVEYLYSASRSASNYLLVIIINWLAKRKTLNDLLYISIT